MSAPKKKGRNCGCLFVYLVLGIFAVLLVVNFGQDIGLVPRFDPLPTSATVAPTLEAIPTETPSYAEISTVGEWILATNDHKQAIVRVWAQRLDDADLVTMDAQTLAPELLDCVNETIGPSPQPLGIDYLVDDIVATCAVLLNE